MLTLLSSRTMLLEVQEILELVAHAKQRETIRDDKKHSFAIGPI